VPERDPLPGTSLASAARAQLASVLDAIWDPGHGLAREREGLIACAPPDARDEDGAPATCELSAAAAGQDGVVVFNDKPGLLPDRTSVFLVDPTADDPTPRSLADPVLASFRKWEDAEPWANGQVLVTTGFDRIRDEDATWDGFNGLVLWRPGDSPRVIGGSARDGVTSSRALRRRFTAALADDTFPDGPPYFKIEGLAGLPDGRVLFGVREIGRTYQDFDHTMIILAARDLESIADSPLERVWTFDPREDPRIEKPLGLSGMTWDRQRRGLWLTTSWETGTTAEDLGGHLWWLTAGALDSGGDPHLVTDGDGTPVVFVHKPEAVTVLDDGRLLVVHDDDRVVAGDAAGSARFRRALHQSAFEVLAPQ
jgi:hypothetical protein